MAVLVQLLTAATRYDGDGVLVPRLELERWYINHARFTPENESDRLSLTNAANRDYDTCEGWDGETGGTSFGSNAAEWAQWIVERQPLAPNAVLNNCASNHSRDILETGLFQHDSPSSNYYPIGSWPKDRQAYDGYTNVVSGWYENIASGGQAGTSSYPPYGRPPDDVHRGLYVDDDDENRGHRKSMINSDAREIGLGWFRTHTYEYFGDPWYTNFYVTRDCDTQDFAKRGNDHFFTGTVFYDANSNGFYEEGEGVGGIEVRLWNGAQEAAWFDASQPSGNFAIPIEDLTDGNTITVQLINTNPASKRLTIPIGYNAMGEFELAASESINYGTFRQPDVLRNVGFRDTAPLFSSTSVTLGVANATVSFSSLERAVYDVQSTESLSPAAWTNFAAVTAAQDVSQVIDTGQGGRTAPADVPHRFYRIILRRY